jgi:hypothetical protein
MGGNFVSLCAHLQRLTVPVGSGKRRGSWIREEAKLWVHAGVVPSLSLLVR